MNNIFQDYAFQPQGSCSTNWDHLLSALRKKLPNLLAIYGFGSRMEGTYGPESDWDLAILVPGKLDPLTLWNMAGSLACTVDNPVDLLDLRTATTVMQYQIITTGKRLWNKDQHAAIYESFILSEKTALDESRNPLLAIIQREGIVHGR